MNKEELIEVFKDTKKKTKGRHSHSQKLRFTMPLKVSVIASDTVSAIIQYADKVPVALNMASLRKPGGGVANGAMAQEECLFRCSNLHHSISKHAYPLKHNEAIYTHAAEFIKDRFYEDLPEPVNCDIITIPAVNINSRYRPDALMTDKEYTDLTSAKMRLIFRAAEENNRETLILGAWGCGVFKNDPQRIASMFWHVINELNNEYAFKRTSLKHIVFAIINDKNANSDNLKTFENMFL